MYQLTNVFKVNIFTQKTDTWRFENHEVSFQRKLCRCYNWRTAGVKQKRLCHMIWLGFNSSCSKKNKTNKHTKQALGLTCSNHNRQPPSLDTQSSIHCLSSQECSYWITMNMKTSFDTKFYWAKISTFNFVKSTTKCLWRFSLLVSPHRYSIHNIYLLIPLWITPPFQKYHLSFKQKI